MLTFAVAKCHVAIKDYYKILGLSDKASFDEIKKSYHVLVHHFHPDKNQNDSFATQYFLEIQEAYEILSKPASRRAYDEERRYSNIHERPKPTLATAPGILHRAQQLATDVRRMDTYRIDMSWLRAAVAHLLSNQHVSILLMAGLTPLREAFLTELMEVMSKLEYPYPEDIMRPMEALAAKETKTFEQWNDFIKLQKRRHLMRKLMPWIAVLATIGVCIFMYFYAQKR